MSTENTDSTSQPLEHPVQVFSVNDANGQLIGQTLDYSEATGYVSAVTGTTLDRKTHTQSMPELKPLPTLTQ